MSINFKQLEALVWAADLGSFSKAAARLNTTQPNISTRIRTLEEFLHLTLLERDAGSVRLTPRGRELTEHARGILSAMDSLISVAGDPSLITGTLRLGVTELLVHTWLQRLLKAIKERFPEMQIELTIDLSVNLSKELNARNIDLALQNGPFDLANLDSHELDTYALTWVAAPVMGLSGDATLTAQQICKHPILTHARDTPLFTQLSNHFRQVDAYRPQLVPSSNLAACLYMAINGMGVATLPRMMVREAIDRGEVVELSYAWVPESLEFRARFSEKRSPLYVSEIAMLAQEVARQYRSDVVC